MNQNTNVNLIPKFPFSGNLYFSQYDVGRVATINLVEDGTAYTIPSGATVKIQATKPSGLGFSVECTYSGSVVTVVSTETMTDEYGRFPCELRIESGGVLLGTTNFTFNVEKSPHPEGTTDGTAESVVSEITLALQNALTDIQAEGATQIGNVQAKGTEVLDSIPSDYTELSNDVEDLKNAIETVFDNSETIEATPTHTYSNNYLYISSGLLADASWNGGDSISIPLSECGDILKVGFDSSATYPGNGQIALILSASDSLGSSAPNYYSKTNMVNGHSSMAVRGIDNSHIADGYYTIEIAKLKTALPSINAINVNFPTGSYLLKKTDVKETKYVEFLHVANVVPALVVAPDGSGDYTTITEAVSKAVDGDTIYIKDSEYKETVVINKYVHLVGQSKQNTILYQNIGNYNNCPLSITQGSVCNMTIKSIAPSDTSGLTDYAYAIHLDKNFASETKYQKCEIYNCDIISEVNDAIGAGTNYASEYDIHDCFVHVAHAPVKALACGFKCHNGQNQTTGKVTLKNNVFITEDADGTTCYDILYHNGGISNTQPIEILQVGNVLKYYHNGITQIFVPSGYNFGNSVSEMNTL